MSLVYEMFNACLYERHSCFKNMYEFIHEFIVECKVMYANVLYVNVLNVFIHEYIVEFIFVSDTIK